MLGSTCSPAQGAWRTSLRKSQFPVMLRVASSSSAAQSSRPAKLIKWSTCFNGLSIFSRWILPCSPSSARRASATATDPCIVHEFQPFRFPSEFCKAMWAVTKLPLTTELFATSSSLSPTPIANFRGDLFVNSTNLLQHHRAASLCMSA